MLSYVIKPIYSVVGNYGWALILFTIIIKLIIFPLGIKQQKITSKTKIIKPELDALQKKYKNDKEKLNAETMKLYQKHEVSPLGGCLPLLIQFPIILGLYRVIQQPVTFLLGIKPVDVIIKAGDQGRAFLESIAKTSNVDISGIVNTAELFEKLGKHVNEIKLASELKLIDFNFYGINLAETPSYRHISLLWVIPILATAITVATTYVTKWLNGPSQNDQQAQMLNSMNMVMPVMTLMITFTTPAGVGLYWFMSSVLSIGQMILLTKYYDKKFYGAIPAQNVIIPAQKEGSEEK